MLDLIREIGAVAGLAAFFGLALLALLYFQQARDVRRLRENAEFLIEHPEEFAAAEEPAQEAEAAETAEEPAAAAASSAPPAKKPKAAQDAEAFRRAELARQAAERRQRFERRRRGERGLAAASTGGRMDSMPETRSLVVIVIGVALLVAGLAFGATRFLGGDESDGGGKKAAPTQVEVAVLNSTAELGLAGDYGRQVEKAGFTLGKVSNSPTPEETSIVEFDQGGQEAAQQVATLLDIKRIEPISGEIRGLADGAPVAVVLGADKETGG